MLDITNAKKLVAQCWADESRPDLGRIYQDPEQVAGFRRPSHAALRFCDKFLEYWCDMLIFSDSPNCSPVSALYLSNV
jgi:hypothetical protein